ncbi:MAG: biopolymer transporter ExbD [Burkholderiaceae bacterium]|jgi:biopolymer transport protein TolR|nr:biopolymer transporter ExbD [Burkholderiaceae bacterium]
MPAPAGSRGRRRTINEINMVPFIDVMLVLLIIFMVTAPMLTPGVIDVPSVGKASQQPIKFATLAISKNGQLQFQTDGNTRAVTEKEAAEAALHWQKSQPDGKAAVIIAAEKSVTYETVVKAMSALQKVGVQRVGLSVKQGG